MPVRGPGVGFRIRERVRVGNSSERVGVWK